MTSCLFGVVITEGAWWVAVIITIINTVLIGGILSSFVLYKYGKQTISDFYEFVVAISPIVCFEILIAILPFIPVK